MFIINIKEKFARYNNSFHLSFGVYNDGNQMIHQGKKYYFVGNVNNTEIYHDLQHVEFTQSLNSKKMLAYFTKDKFEVSDYIIFN